MPVEPIIDALMFVSLFSHMFSTVFKWWKVYWTKLLYRELRLMCFCMLTNDLGFFSVHYHGLDIDVKYVCICRIEVSVFIEVITSTKILSKLNLHNFYHRSYCFDKINHRSYNFDKIGHRSYNFDKINHRSDRFDKFCHRSYHFDRNIFIEVQLRQNESSK